MHISREINLTADEIEKRVRVRGISETWVCSIPSWICNLVGFDRSYFSHEAF